MKFSKNTGIGGVWLDKKTLRDGDMAKLLTEAIEVEGQNGKQIVAKIKIKGEKEEKNVAINTPTKNALIDAFGEDSKNWVGQVLDVRTEKGVFAGKRGIALYLVPEGYELTEDSSGYVVISKRGLPESGLPDSLAETPEEINAEDIPF